MWYETMAPLRADEGIKKFVDPVQALLSAHPMAGTCASLKIQASSHPSPNPPKHAWPRTFPIYPSFFWPLLDCAAFDLLIQPASSVRDWVPVIGSLLGKQRSRPLAFNLPDAATL